MAQRIYLSDLRNKEYDHVLISMGAIEYDARLLNIAYTLQSEYPRILLIGLATPNWLISCKDINADVLLLDEYTYNPMFKLWIAFYWWLYSFKRYLKAKSFWAMDLYTLPFVVRLAEKSRGNSIYDSREVYSKLGEISEHPIKQKVLAFIERWFVKRVSKVFTSGPLDSKYLAKIYNIPLPEVVMNVPRFQSPAKSNRLRKCFGISDEKKIIIYQGVIHPGRGLMKFVHVLSHIPDFVLCILGSGESYKKQLEEAAHAKNVRDRLFFHDPVPYSELLEWTSSADLGLCLIEPLSLSLEYALPNKLFEYVMAGIPPVISDLPQMIPFVEKYDCGIIIPSDAESLLIIDVVKDALNPTNYLRMKENTRNLAREMNWENQRDKIFQIASFI